MAEETDQVSMSNSSSTSASECSQTAGAKQQQKQCQNQSAQICPDIGQQLQKCKRDLESMVLKYAKSERENLQNKHKADELDERLKRVIRDNESLANRIKILTNDKNQLSETLSSKLAQLTVLEQKNLALNHLQDVKLKELEHKIIQLEQTNDDLQKELDGHKSRESELLEFSERLSMKHILLQSQLDKALESAPAFEEQYAQAIREKQSGVKEAEALNKQLAQIQEDLSSERGRNFELIKEKNQSEINYKKLVDELKNEISLLTRKHQMAGKAMLKEIRKLRIECGSE